MWAFARYDRPKGEVFLFRDRFRIKSLYSLYCVLDRDRLAFALEIKALFVAFADLRKENLRMASHLLPSDALDSGTETSFKNNVCLALGCNLTLHLGRFSSHIERYWDLDPEAFQARSGESNPVRTLRDLLESAVSPLMCSMYPLALTSPEELIRERLFVC